jgi:hypothetical protein
VKYKHRELAPPAKCNGKNCYKSEKEARLVARQQELLDLQGKTEIKVYQCQFCGKWHLTSVK